MRAFTLKLLFLVTVLILCSNFSFAQYTWTKYPGNPVIQSGPSGSWYSGVITPCVIYNDDLSRYEMWFAGSPTTYGERPHRIGFAFSPDGISWQVLTTAVIEPRPANWDNYSVNAPWVVRENGQYKMWYTHEAPGYTNYKLGYATSPDGINWTRLNSPVMEAGTAEWETQGVGMCSVIPATGGYKMWYSGLAGTSDTISIGYAVSTDGINWQRDTINNPILSPGTAGQWDDFNIFAPRVIILDNAYYMYYGANRESFGQYRVGLATSTDGIDWEKYWDNPVLRPSPSGWDNSEIETATIIKMGNTLKLWYDGSNSGTYHWQIGLATSPYLPNTILPGTYTVGTGGNFATIQEAFNKLSTDGIAGNVTLELIDNLYIAPAQQYGYVLNGPIPGSGAASRVTLRPADNVDVTIEGDGEAVLAFNDVSYFTIDGINLQGATRLKVHAFYNNQGMQWNDAIDFYGNCDYIQVKNLTASSDDINRYSTAIFISHKNQNAPDSGLISGVFVPVANAGIYLLGDGTYNPTGFVLSGNHMGSPIDSLSSWGIQNQTADGTIIENNHIENMRKGNYFYSLYFIYGIQSFNSDNVIIRNNIIHNIAATNGPTRLQGIFVSGDVGQRGSNNWIYNNMVYDIRTYVSNVEWLAGIFVGDHNSPRIEYNSVSLSEVGDAAPNSGSAAIWIHPTVTNPSLQNNILVNTRNDEPRTAVAVKYLVDGVSDYNNLYVGSFEHSYIGSRGSTFYKTLPEWQATGKDLNSLNESVNFVSSGNLHINSNYATLLNGRATPIAGITKDFDGETRSTLMPDIGADEFELSSSASNWQMMNTNYPSDVAIVDFSAVDNQVCWAVGQKYPHATIPYAGFIRTTDGGNTWVCDTIQGVTYSYFQQVFAIDSDTAFVTLYKILGTSGTSRGVYKTTDGGTSWIRQEAYNNSASGPGYIHFFDSQNGVVIGDPNLETYTTSNGGLTWNPVTMPSVLNENEYTWASGNGITAIGNTVWFSTGARIFKSTNKGYTWEVILSEPAYIRWYPCISFEDEMTGLYSLKKQTTLDCIYRKTTNGGSSWETLTNSVIDNIAPTGMQYIPGTPSTFVLSGGMPAGMRGTAVTYDAGENWYQIDTLGAIQIAFPSETVGWYSQWSPFNVLKYVGPRITTVEEEIIDIIPTDYSLSQNYPNPFNPSTTFRYSIPEPSKVVIKVYDILGNEIALLMDEEKSAGTYELTWNAASLPSGVFFYQLKAGEFISTKKMLLLK